MKVTIAPAGRLRCSACGFWVHKGQRIVPTISKDRTKTLIVTHEECAR